MRAVDLPPNPRKTSSMRALGAVDITGLRAAVLEIPESIWDSENAQKPNRFEALDRTRHIVFRFVDSTLDWRRSHDRALWGDWAERLMPVLTQATQPYGYRRGAFPRVMLARMAPGGVIHPHVDANAAARWPHKIHVPLQTNPAVEFRLGEDLHHFPEGQGVEVNNLGVHGVRNSGDSDRIHLIFEYFDLDQPEPDWIDTAAAPKRAG